MHLPIRMIEAPASGGPRPTSRVQGRSTRAALLGAAIHLVAEVGWGSVTTRMVARQARVGSGVVHYHFRSLESLLVEAVIDFNQRAAEELIGVLRSSRDISRGLTALGESVASVAVDAPTMVVFVETALASSRVEELRTAMRGLVAQMTTEIAEWLHGCGYEGDAVAAATLVLATLDGWALRRMIVADGAPDLVVEGLHAVIAEPDDRRSEPTSPEDAR